MEPGLSSRKFLKFTSDYSNYFIYILIYLYSKVNKIHQFSNFPNFFYHKLFLSIHTKIKKQKERKNKMKIIIIAILSLLFLSGCSNNQENTNYADNTYTTERTAINVQNSNNIINEPQTIELDNTENTTNTLIPTSIPTTPIEEELSSFTTELLTDDDKRENNIEITCSKINNCTVKSGETFSFTDTVGKATEAKGYEKADIFDANGNKTKGLGGGNCQVSSTLYNAVLQAGDKFEIVERHKHSQKVYYVPDGMDATVSYGSLDFKFKNNNDFDIKIYASSTETDVTVRIVKIS